MSIVFLISIIEINSRRLTKKLRIEPTVLLALAISVLIYLFIYVRMSEINVAECALFALSVAKVMCAWSKGQRDT